MTGEYKRRRPRAEARPHHFEQARQWDEEGFRQRHATRKDLITSCAETPPAAGGRH
ncbi:hypothetical protein IQ279_14335 [Streptomyces verrucosisporus]|uniref:hypothetical protein n=1 Tax=Streptomyces verrucosisporus TaxID=1695161 RepID=UPI0019D0EA71|nr:hypothetical protein [Streptomyces verrucosisporus]MBN3930798.1 hypothetical protein [Streptomyces verrucosisporus]